MTIDPFEHSRSHKSDESPLLRAQMPSILPVEISPRHIERREFAVLFDDTYRGDTRYAQRGLSTYREYLDGVFQKPFSQALRAFKQRIERGMVVDPTVLDIGAGHGLGLHQILAELRSEERAVHGVGLSLTVFPRHHVPFAREDQVLADVFLGIPLADSSVHFGVSVAGPVPKDMNETVALFHELLRVMAPQSAFFLHADRQAIDGFFQYERQLGRAEILRGVSLKSNRVSRNSLTHWSLKVTKDAH